MNTNIHGFTACAACGLNCRSMNVLNSPINAEVMWVGLSAKNSEDGESIRPLSTNTNSGKLIQVMETEASHYSFYRTNLVKCPPLDEQNKLRYPNACEMEACYGNLKYEISNMEPKIVFLLGTQVGKFVLKKHGRELPSLPTNYDYGDLFLDNIHYVPIHHPSFINVYRRKTMNLYFAGVVNVMNRLLGRISMPASQDAPSLSELAPVTHSE